MNSIATQRRKTVVLASSIAMFSVAASQLIVRHHGSRYETAVAVVYGVFLLSMLVYVIMNLVKLKRMERDRR